MYTVNFSKKYSKAIKKLVKAGKAKLTDVNLAINILANAKPLPAGYRDHKLRGEYEGFRECHIQGDLLLVYKIEKKELILLLVDIGSHSYLF